MSSHSASFNYPPDFLWGIIPYDGFEADKENFSYIFRLQEKHIKAVQINVSRAACEPLRGNYNEEYIETLRTLLTRIHSRYINTLVILNTKDAPGWQKLDHPNKEDYSDEYNFLVHLTDALCPYTNFFGIQCPDGTIFNRSSLTSRLEVITDICGHIQSLSESVQTVLVLNSMKNEWLDLVRYRFIKDIPVDCLGVNADENTFKAVQSLFWDEHKPILILSDNLKKEQPVRRAEIMADNLYSFWRFYQTGWPILGYFSETDITTASKYQQLYDNSSINNAFMISDDMPYLPEKWRNFLKD